jgi:hypothetical protein
MNHPLGRDKIAWKHLYLGFESTEFAQEKSRLDHIKSTRKGIQDTFASSALHRWTSSTWKTARVDPKLDHTRALANIVNDELARAIKPGIDVAFRVEAKESLVGVRLLSGKPLTGAPDIKPDGVTCWYCGARCWEDVIEFPVKIASGPGAGNEWSPDARHDVKACLVYDCPYETRTATPKAKAAPAQSRKRRT